MFFNNFKKSATMVLGAAIVSLLMAGCGTDGASDVGTAPNPTEKVTITAANADKVLASTVGGIGKIAAMIEELTEKLPGVAAAGSDYAIAGSEKSVSGKLAIALTSRDCEGGGSISVDSLNSSGGSVTFNHCQERGVILDGSAEVSIGGSSNYDIRFTNVEATFSTGSLSFSDAGASVDGSNIDFKIASGTANIQGILVDVANFELVRDASGIFVSGSIRTACINGWVDVETTEALKFNKNEILVGGKFLVNGDASNILVEANSDGSISVYLNGALYNTYDSASDLPQYNAVCS